MSTVAGDSAMSSFEEGGSAPLLRAAGVTKTYGGVTALADVALEIAPGEVHALMGANGAGKSTLIKIIAGVERMDSGTVEWRGNPASFHNVGDALASGIAVMFQQLNVVEDLSVSEYLVLGREVKRLGLLSKRASLVAAKAMLDHIGVELDVDRPAATLTVAERELVEIARAVSRDARLVVMDEPTASLGPHEIDKLFQVIRGLTSRGVAILYVSHHLEEVIQLADRTTVLRDGRNAGELDRSAAARDTLVGMMIGASAAVGDRVARTRRFTGTRPLLELRDVATSNDVRNVSLIVHEGEVVGLYGLMGAGRTELLRALYGLERVMSGDVTFAGSRLDIRSPIQARQRGIGFVPEDRLREALIGDASVAANLTLAAPEKVSKRGLFSSVKERRVATASVREIGIKVPSVAARVTALSGGNQQKVVIGRWLVRGTRLLLLDDPTVGVDVGAKQEIYRLIHEATESGMGVVVSSSELDELMRLADRIVVMHRRCSVGEFDAADHHHDAIVRLAIEGSHPEVIA